MIPIMNLKTFQKNVFIPQVSDPRSFAIELIKIVTENERKGYSVQINYKRTGDEHWDAPYTTVYLLCSISPNDSLLEEWKKAKLKRIEEKRQACLSKYRELHSKEYYDGKIKICKQRIEDANSLIEKLRTRGLPETHQGIVCEKRSIEKSNKMIEEVNKDFEENQRLSQTDEAIEKRMHFNLEYEMDHSTDYDNLMHEIIEKRYA